MRSLLSFAPALVICAITSPSVADAPPQRTSAVIAVLDFRSTAPGSDTARVVDRVRRAAKEAFPGAALVSRDEIAGLLPDLAPGCAGDCAVRAGRMLIADLVVSGNVARKGDALAVSLELRDTRDGDLIGTATANGVTAEEVEAAAASAAADLFRPLRVPASASGDPAKARAAEPAAFAIAPAALPDQPVPLGPAREGLVVDYDVDADVLALYEKARAADASGADHPDEAAGAWNAVASAPGENPFHESASERARTWEAYAAKKRVYDEQRAADTARLRKVLSVKWASYWVKLDLVERYARAYGDDAARQTLASARSSGLREKASLALACEAKDAAKCTELARLADEASEPRVAVVYLDRACGAGSSQACLDAGSRSLAEPTRNVERAVSALQRGCEAKLAASCARLARVYEEGDGGKVDLAAAADLRNKACAAGDGSSCRRLACLIDPSASDAAKTRAEELWSSGCAAGDEQSCALIRAAKASAGAAAPVAVDDGAAQAAREYQIQKRRSLGAGLLAIGTVLGTAAAAMAVDTYSVRGPRGRSFLRRFDTDPPAMTYVLGAGAALSVGAGLAILFTKPEPEQVSVGVAPNGVTVSGRIP